MSQEFYLKTQAFYEEFKKRELHYLKTEMKLRNNIASKRELNLPLQEYLQRINQKEKESEVAYKNIMKQMEELDRRTDLMSSKLDKLGILRNSLTSFTLPNLPSNARSCLQMYDTKQDFISSNHVYETSAHNMQPISQRNLRSISTQTENIYCGNCNSPILSEPKHLTESKYPLYLHNHSGINVEPQATCVTKSQETLDTLNGVVSDSQCISSENNEHFTVSANIDVKNSQIEHPMFEKSSRENSHSDMILSKKHSLIENIQNKSLENGEETTKLCNSGKENYEFKSPSVDVNAGAVDTFINVEDTLINSEDTIINVEDTFTSKSDAESMNNEFDFLERDKRVVSSKMKTQDITQINTENPSSDKEASLAVKYSPSTPSKHKDKVASQPKSKLDVSDNKSETSGSVSGPHSPTNVSVGSDSDSIYEKGTSATASAEYEALLRNNTVIPKTRMANSDSESEDEVENAVANIVQKSIVNSNSSEKAETKNEKPSSEATDSKPAIKGSKLPFSQKPKNKLSKETKKVLGYDTSSGSDEELPTKLGKKIEEDSDEFNFYN